MERWAIRAEELQHSTPGQSNVRLQLVVPQREEAAGNWLSGKLYLTNCPDSLLSMMNNATIASLFNKITPLDHRYLL